MFNIVFIISIVIKLYELHYCCWFLVFFQYIF
ncbi:hypothetical protein [Campylobacter phage CJLB-14]|nr:hypothetical protein [Campylobacter phage CJLB-14]